MQRPKHILRRPSRAKPGRPWRVSMRSFDRYVMQCLRRTRIPVYETIAKNLSWKVLGKLVARGCNEQELADISVSAKRRLVRWRRPSRAEAVAKAVREVIRKAA